MAVVYQSVRPRVIVYSYQYPKPINLTPLCTAVQCNRSIAGSTAETAILRVARSAEAYILAEGDWVQIDQTDLDGRVEHIWFGRFSSVKHGFTTMGEGGGAKISTTLTATCWGTVFKEFHKEMRMAWQLFLRDMAGLTDLMQEDVAPPAMLVMLAAILADEGVNVQPQRAVSMVMQFIARYGGTLRQQFWLPASFYNGKMIPLHWLICKMNRTRLDGTQQAIVPVGNPLPNYVSDPDAFNFAVAAAGAMETENTQSAWTVSDWKVYFDRCAYYQSGHDLLTEVVREEQDADCWTMMNDMGDTAWCQLACSMVEKIEHKGLTGTFTAHDSTEFERKFLLTVTFKPHTHPVYYAKTPAELAPRKDPEGGDDAFKIEADATGYSLCPKFVVNADMVQSFDMSHSAENVFTYWMTMPRSSLWSPAWIDGVALSAAMNFQIPIIDAPTMGKWGHRPNETTTRFFLGGADSKAKDVIYGFLIRKTLLQYAWTVQGARLLNGGFNIPGFSANAPRPGDVGYIRGTVQSSGEALDRSGSGLVPHASISDDTSSSQMLAEGSGQAAGKAMSVYVESTTYTMQQDAGSGSWTSSTFCQYSHGQDVEVVADFDPVASFGVPYHRFFDASEVGLDVRHYLPWRWDVGSLLKTLPLDIDTPINPAHVAPLELNAQDPDPPLPATPAAPPETKKPAPAVKKRKKTIIKGKPPVIEPFSGIMTSELQPDVIDDPGPLRPLPGPIRQPVKYLKRYQEWFGGVVPPWRK